MKLTRTTTTTTIIMTDLKVVQAFESALALLGGP